MKIQTMNRRVIPGSYIAHRGRNCIRNTFKLNYHRRPQSRNFHGMIALARRLLIMDEAREGSKVSFH
ncbi:acyl-protein thioesterase 1 [Moniliophthora roreri]|nr:acyl-protein thioesterase 1 [Moniliophthora roreri]